MGDYGFTYGTNGATESFDYGNGVWESISYNERLQPVEQTLGYWWSTYLWRTYQFDAPGGGNNGNVWGIADHVNAAYTQQFDYDFRNRITLFTSNGLGSMAFEYDRWGNRKKQCGTGGAPTMNLTVGTNNRATARRTGGKTGIPACRRGFRRTPRGGNPRKVRTTKCEVRMSLAETTSRGAGPASSLGDGLGSPSSRLGEGRRAVKTSGAGTRIYFYDAFGDPILESANSQGAWLAAHAFFNGRHVYENTGQLLWRHVDHLGSAAVRTGVNGGKLGDWRYYPFGERAVGSAAVDPYEFTGKERDAETGLDYFGARYYGNALGRFTSPDWIGGFTDAPQSLNQYAYALNNPLRYVDAGGELAVPVIPVGGVAIGAAWGGIDAWYHGESIERGVVSGAAGGFVASMTYPWNPFIAGALTAGTANIAGQLYDVAAGDKQVQDIDLASLGMDMTVGALIGRTIGPVVKDHPKWRWQGLITPRPGWVPKRLTTSVGPKVKDLYRAFVLGGWYGMAYHMAWRDMMPAYAFSDLASYRMALIEAEARASRLQPDVRITEIRVIDVLDDKD